MYDIRSLLTDEEAMVQDTVARFVNDKVLPDIREHFDNHTFPRELISEFAALGLLGSTIDGYGCAGMSNTAYGLICQELERGDSGIRSFVSVQSSLVMHPIHAYGSDAQKEEWLPKLASGEAVGCFGLTESHGGSDPGNMKTVAKRDGDDWVLNGSKMWITNSPIADVAVVWAMTEQGIRGFIVPTSTPGFSVQEIHNKFSLRASLTGALFLDNVRLPEDAVLPNVQGLRGPLGCLTKARFG
ncbi:MAG: acyl-CoA dehydrogenase family protein, partial [Pseudomonadota bacterium]